MLQSVLLKIVWKLEAVDTHLYKLYRLGLWREREKEPNHGLFRVPAGMGYMIYVSFQEGIYWKLQLASWDKQPINWCMISSIDLVMHSISSWWFQPTHLKNVISSNWASSSLNCWDENSEKSLSCHHLDMHSICIRQCQPPLDQPNLERGASERPFRVVESGWKGWLSRFFK